MKNRILLVLVALLPLLASAQTRYRAYKKSDGTQIVRRESTPGSGVFDVTVGSLPSDAVAVRGAARVLLPWALEGKQQINLDQFGLDKYYAPNYFFSLDYNTPQDNVAKRKQLGISMFSRFVQPNQAEYNALPQNQKIYYQTENELHGPYEGAKYYESTLAEIESHYINHIPSGVGVYVPNIETSTEWNQWRYGSNVHGYDSWDVAQNRSIKCEIDGQTRTLGQIYSQGLWEAEYKRRRANRNAIMATIARQRNTYFAYGSSMHQGEPRTNSLSNTSIFIDGSADVNAIGGSNGTITLNGRTYSGINKNVFEYENVMLDYYYYFDSILPTSDYTDIFFNRSPGTQTLPYIWSKQLPYHIVASEKGHWQANKYKMLNVPGQTNRGSIRMQEPFYEGNFYTTDGVVRSAFMPFQEVQGIALPDGYVYTPKVWLPPYYMAGAYIVHRFLEGDTPFAGYHLFNAPGLVKTPTSDPVYNHHLHTITALRQARADMQPYEQFYAGSTLEVDPLVQINQTGAYSAYSGATAFAFGPDGSRGTQLPAFIARYKSVPGGTRIVVVGGMVQNWTSESTHNVRITLPGTSSPTTLAIKLRGPYAQVFDFFVPSGESGQTYTASFTAQSAWEKAGYGGRVGSAQN